MRLRGRGRLRQAHARAAGEGRENAKSKRAPRHAAAAASIRRRWRRDVLRIMLRLTCSLVACWLDVAARVALLTRPLPNAASEAVGSRNRARPARVGGLLLLLMPPFPRDGAWGPWEPNHVLVARTGKRRRNQVIVVYFFNSRTNPAVTTPKSRIRRPRLGGLAAVPSTSLASRVRCYLEPAHRAGFSA